MLISIVNRSNSISDAELQTVIRAINRQIKDDFEPYWSFGATLRLEGAIGSKPDKNAPAELRGDAIIYLWDEVDVDGAVGYHDTNARGIPYGFVFTKLSKELGENWTVTLSHEALELLGDPQGNLLVQGPHPTKPGVEVFHWFEMCDAVQGQSYKVDGVEVSNFVLPLYFTPEEQEGGRNDFLGQLDSKKKGLASFGVSKGGYIGFFDPRKRAHETYANEKDAKAQKRMAIKTDHQYGRGYLRKNSEASVPREDAHMRMLGGESFVKASATPSNDPIKHVVVLMLENRSFDQMLGGMTRFNKDVDGIPQKSTPRSNKTSKGHVVQQKPGAAWVLDKGRDPNHEHDDTMKQLGTAANPMSGFAESFLQRYPDATPAELDQVMAYFDFGATPKDDTLPALHSLARNFTVCDRWFSSMPGPTWQNRFFIHSGTCLGHLTMPSKQEPQNMRIYYQDTIFDRLSDGRVNWKIFHAGIPQSIVLTRLLTRYLTFRGYKDMDDFYEMAAGDANEFPEYAFIEPQYFGKDENDQHPPSDIRKGEMLLANVYNALRSNDELWKSTLFVVTYDEHGGFYDHVSPPATVPPDNHTADWSFDRLGVRVPTILVSPWLDAKVNHTVFDHTSLLRYLCDKWKLDPLGQRMQAGAGALRANSMADALQFRTTPRNDTPVKITVPQIKGALTSQVEPPIEGSRESLLMFVSQLPEAGGDQPLTAATVKGKLSTTKKPAAKRAKPKSTELNADVAQAKLERLRNGNTPS